MKDCHVGFTGCYIQDHNFKHLCDIPVSAAVKWVKKVCPEATMGNKTKAKELTLNRGIDTDALMNGWLNKLFVVVANDHDAWIALVNWDGRFSIYIERK